MNSELKQLQAELKELQGKLEGIDDDNLLRDANSECGRLRREIRKHHKRASNLAMAQPRFVKRGRV